MAKSLNPLIRFFNISTLLLLISSLVLVSELEARPLSIIKIAFDRLHSIQEIKTGSGPGQGGKGHSFANALCLGGIKTSGPSPGGSGH